jgi:hypothetical protein
LKMQGVDALGDFAVQIRAKMMPAPGEQFVIRRQASQVADESEAATAAAVAQRTLELTRPHGSSLTNEARTMISRSCGSSSDSLLSVTLGVLPLTHGHHA